MDAAETAMAAIPNPDLRDCLSLPADYLVPRWYAAYTCANHEKRVAEQLGQRTIEHFLPLYETVRRWKDRRARLRLPLFPGYGPLQGLEGSLVQKRNKARFVVSLDLIMRSIAVEVEALDLEPADSAGRQRVLSLIRTELT